ncbi:hypothetical protein [Mesorhizobium sophorae]|uniref:hypothetical protein n=1 Tax=Mesorhizobium sophorae TaxID=1300294 RepID=UPI0011814EBD|nr:hypothetical protein [Mesorhizobium sophorae]
MRKLTILALAFVPSLAFADDKPPVTVYVRNASEKTALTSECETPVGGEMTCHFRQLTVTKPDEAKAEERISKATDDLLKSMDTQSQECPKFAAMVGALESGKPPADVDEKAFEDNWGKTPPEAKADTLTVLKAFMNLCGNRDRASAEAVARASETVEGSKCSITNWTFDKTFQLNYSTKRWQSTVQNSDSCGTIDYAEFARPTDLKDPGYFWNYTAKTLVTNPGGQTILGASCNTVDQQEHKFTWQAGEFFANCRYVQLSP